jgi:hypothetical protein
MLASRCAVFVTTTDVSNQHINAFLDAATNSYNDPSEEGESSIGGECPLRLADEEWLLPMWPFVDTAEQRQKRLEFWGRSPYLGLSAEQCAQKLLKWISQQRVLSPAAFVILDEELERGLVRCCKTTPPSTPCSQSQSSSSSRDRQSRTPTSEMDVDSRSGSRDSSIEQDSNSSASSGAASLVQQPQLFRSSALMVDEYLLPFSLAHQWLTLAEDDDWLDSLALTCADESGSSSQDTSFSSPRSASYTPMDIESPDGSTVSPRPVASVLGKRRIRPESGLDHFPKRLQALDMAEERTSMPGQV